MSKRLQGWSLEVDQHQLLHLSHRVCPIVVDAAPYWNRHIMKIPSVNRNVGLWCKGMACNELWILEINDSLK